jgi:RimJ/RimL family protein N-acetyltransferase
VSVPATLDRVETARMVLARLRSDHLEALSRLLRDRRVASWIWPRSDPLTDHEVSSLLTDKIGHWDRHGFGMWLLQDRFTGEVVGRGGLQWTHLAGLREVEVGWAIFPERWGQGLATELALASVDAAFGPLGLQQIVAFGLPANAASRRVMDKAGLTFERDIVHAGLPHVLYRRRASLPGALLR